MILILNGTSSSGKTSIVRALQTASPTPFLDAGIDKFLWMLPQRYLNEPDYWQQVYRYSWTAAGEMQIEAQALGHQLMSGMHHAIAALAHAGNSVVADHVLTEPAWVTECAHLFAGLPAYLIAIRCPLNVLEQRERERRDRTLGQARAQFHRVHAHTIYDVEVDTSQLGAETCAARILEFVAAHPPGAFGRLANLAG